jgi:tRNA threonylcarbamoyladenosine biosynthesis protein TsaB
VKLLAIETSTVQGSVALIEQGRCLGSLTHRQPNAHAEAILPLIEQLLNQVGWKTAMLKRVAVGTGPGSFTGLRVGIALGQGIAASLGVDAVGVPSLLAMARGVEATCPGLRCPIIDARRGEVFVAAYDEHLQERLSPRALSYESLLDTLQRELAEPFTLVGEFAAQVAPGSKAVSDRLTALPHAEVTGLVGADAPSGAEIVPHYVRAPDAKLPNLPPSPLGG